MTTEDVKQNKQEQKQRKDALLASQRRIEDQLPKTIRNEIEQTCRDKLGLAETNTITITKFSNNIQMRTGDLPTLILDGALLVLDEKKYSYYVFSSELPLYDLTNFCAQTPKRERDNTLSEFWREAGRNVEFVESEFPKDNIEARISGMTLARLRMYSDDFEEMFADLLRQRLGYRDFREQYFRAFIDRDISIEGTNLKITKISKKRLQITASATVYAENDEQQMRYETVFSQEFSTLKNAERSSVDPALDTIKAHISNLALTQYPDTITPRMQGCLSTALHKEDIACFLSYVQERISKEPLPKAKEQSPISKRTIRTVAFYPTHPVVSSLDNCELDSDKTKITLRYTVQEKKLDIALNCSASKTIKSLFGNNDFISFPKAYEALLKTVRAAIESPKQTAFRMPKLVAKDTFTKAELIELAKAKDKLACDNIVIDPIPDVSHTGQRFRVGVTDEQVVVAFGVENGRFDQNVIPLFTLDKGYKYDPAAMYPQYVSDLPAFAKHLHKLDGKFRKENEIKNQENMLVLWRSFSANDLVISKETISSTLEFRRGTHQSKNQIGKLSGKFNTKKSPDLTETCKDAFSFIYASALSAKQNEKIRKMIEDSYEKLTFAEKYALYAVYCADKESIYSTFSASSIVDTMNHEPNVSEKLSADALRSALERLKDKKIQNVPNSYYLYTKVAKGTYGSFDVYGLSRVLVSCGFKIDTLPKLAFGDTEALMLCDGKDKILISWAEQAKTAKERWLVVDALDQLAQDSGTIAARVLKSEAGQALLGKMTKDEWTFFELAHSETNGLKTIIKKEAKRREKKHG